MPTYSFTLTEHDPAKPWLVLSIERRTVELDNSEDFGAWARAQWPGAAFTIDLDLTSIPVVVSCFLRLEPLNSRPVSTVN